MSENKAEESLQTWQLLESLAETSYQIDLNIRILISELAKQECSSDMITAAITGLKSIERVTSYLRDTSRELKPQPNLTNEVKKVLGDKFGEYE